MAGPPRPHQERKPLLAKKRKAGEKAPVNLPPFPSATGTRLAGIGLVRMALAAVEQADIDMGGTLREYGGEATVIPVRAQVWRTKLLPVLNILNPASLAAVMDYADAVETSGASGTGNLPTGAGGGSPSNVSPSLRKLVAAERLRAIHAALQGAEMTVPVKHARRLRRGDGMARVQLR